MEPKQTHCPRCTAEILLDEGNGAYRCEACGARFYVGASVVTEGTYISRAVYYSSKDPEKGPVHLTSQLVDEPTNETEN